MAAEHDEFVALKAIEKYPHDRLEVLKASIIEEAKRTGNMTVEVNFGGNQPAAFVKVERRKVDDGGRMHFTDSYKFHEFELEHANHVEDIDLDGVADLPEPQYRELMEFVAARWPWLIHEYDAMPTRAEYEHHGGDVVFAATGELVPGVEWIIEEPTYSYTVKAVEANDSGNPGSKSPKLEDVARAVGGGYAQLVSGEMFAIEGEVE